MTVLERFLKYIKYDTRSSEESKKTPSTQGQLVLANELANDLKEIGLFDVSVDNNGYVMAQLPANTEEKVPAIGFIAHMDTSPEMNGKDVNTQIISNYNGKDIILNIDQNIVLRTEEFPEIKQYIGKDIITTDGMSLLGADDKAGIAEIITAMDYFIKHPNKKHGTIKICFTPDEEIGEGADHFDVEKFNADYAYTVDGGELGELEYENFNAARADVVIKGRSVHPGSAKDKMINSILIADEFNNLLPQNEIPQCTEGYEGFYHLLSIKGDIEETKLHYIIRDFDKQNFETRKSKLLDIKNELKNKYGEGIIELQVKDQYYNMKEKIQPVKHIVEKAYNAMKSVGVEPKVTPVRGGTDGARLSFMGLPTPNLFTGGHNYHGRYEYIPVFAMEKAVEVIVKIAEIE